MPGCQIHLLSTGSRRSSFGAGDEFCHFCHRFCRTQNRDSAVVKSDSLYGMAELLFAKEESRGSMAAKKMFPPGEVDRPLSKTYDEVKLRIGFRIQAGQIVMQF